MRTEAERPDWLSEELFPFEHRYVDVEGSRIHFIDEGAGPTILFLHGNPTWSFLYRNIISELSNSFRCIALDYPGFGLSTPADGYELTASAHARAVEAFVTKFDLQEVTLMGQDWGGPIGLTVATRHPDRFTGFIMGNTWAWPLNGIFHFEVAARIMGSSVARLWIRSANAFVNVMIPLGTRSKIGEETMRAYREPFSDRRRLATSEFPRELLRSRSFMKDLETRLPQVADLPVLFVWGGSDFALRKSVELPRFEALFPNHHTVVLEKARHFFQEDAPVEVAAAIRDWFAGRNEPRTAPH